MSFPPPYSYIPTRLHREYSPSAASTSSLPPSYSQLSLAYAPQLPPIQEQPSVPNISQWPVHYYDPTAPRGHLFHPQQHTQPQLDPFTMPYIVPQGFVLMHPMPQPQFVSTPTPNYYPVAKTTAAPNYQLVQPQAQSYILLTPVMTASEPSSFRNTRPRGNGRYETIRVVGS